MLLPSGCFKGVGPHPSTIGSSQFLIDQIKKQFEPHNFSPSPSPRPLESNMSKHGSHRSLGSNYMVLDLSHHHMPSM